MLNALATFETAHSEVEIYLKFLQQIELDQAHLCFKNKRTHKTKQIDEELYKILKANAFLLLYNLVESTIRVIIEDIYHAVNSKSLTSDQLADEIRSIWVDVFFRELVKSGALGSTYKRLALDIIEKVIKKELVNFDIDKVRFDGNLDARKIRDLFGEYGIKLSIRKISSGGVELKSVKDQRNFLAHGSSTFTECGRNFTFSDLKRIQKNVAHFMKDILKSVKRYLKAEGYSV